MPCEVEKEKKQRVQLWSRFIGVCISFVVTRDGSGLCSPLESVEALLCNAFRSVPFKGMLFTVTLCELFSVAFLDICFMAFLCLWQCLRGILEFIMAFYVPLALSVAFLALLWVICMNLPWHWFSVHCGYLCGTVCGNGLFYGFMALLWGICMNLPWHTDWHWFSMQYSNLCSTFCAIGNVLWQLEIYCGTLWAIYSTDIALWHFVFHWHYTRNSIWHFCDALLATFRVVLIVIPNAALRTLLFVSRFLHNLCCAVSTIRLGQVPVWLSEVWEPLRSWCWMKAWIFD